MCRTPHIMVRIWGCSGSRGCHVSVAEVLWRHGCAALQNRFWLLATSFISSIGPSKGLSHVWLECACLCKNVSQSLFILVACDINEMYLLGDSGLSNSLAMSRTTFRRWACESERSYVWYTSVSSLPLANALYNGCSLEILDVLVYVSLFMSSCWHEASLWTGLVVWLD